MAAEIVDVRAAGAPVGLVLPQAAPSAAAPRASVMAMGRRSRVIIGTSGLRGPMIGGAAVRGVGGTPRRARYTRDMSTVAPPVRKQKPRSTDPGTGSDRPWLVIVLNDNHNTFDGVAFALAHTIPGLTFDGGMRLANRIHDTGKATVWRGQLEQAELYWEQLQGFGLTMAPLSQSG